MATKNQRMILPRAPFRPPPTTPGSRSRNRRPAAPWCSPAETRVPETKSPVGAYEPPRHEATKLARLARDCWKKPPTGRDLRHQAGVERVPRTLREQRGAVLLRAGAIWRLSSRSRHHITAFYSEDGVLPVRRPESVPRLFLQLS